LRSIIAARLPAHSSYIFDTLVWKDDQGYIPWLATDWQVSDDATTWTFTLRDGVSWQDGEPFTAEDVVFTYEYFKQMTAQGMVKWGWPVDKIASVRVGRRRAVSDL
jgi:ABC-type transport system substrate-binding protein